ncbi:MAG: hypothetical protein WD772_03455, partial [Pseudohongiellaceae bacterium]
VGIRLPSLRELAAHGPGVFMDIPLVIALVACAGLPLLIRWLVSRFGIPAAVTEFHDATNPESKGEIS